MRCPHANIADCPLYVIGHDMRHGLARLTCVDDLAQPCRVKRERKGWSYPAALARLHRAVRKLTERKAVRARVH